MTSLGQTVVSMSAAWIAGGLAIAALETLALAKVSAGIRRELSR